MRKVILYIAQSLDGWIARPDGRLDWLDAVPNPDQSDYGYASFIEQVDTVLMGNKTYRWVVEAGVPDPYPGKKSYVFTRQTGLPPSDFVEYVTEDPADFVQKLKALEGKDIWMTGGGQLNAILLGAGLIDELQVFVMPVILGEGIPLSAGLPSDTRLRLIRTETFASGAILLVYQPEKEAIG
jgi:dihydrofolate reductase